MRIAQGKGESASRRPGLIRQKSIFPLPANPRAGERDKRERGFSFDQPVTSILSYYVSQTNQPRQPTPVERLSCNRTPVARRGCAGRLAVAPL